MPAVASADSDMISSRIASALPLPTNDAFHAEPAEIKRTAAALRMRRVVLVSKLRDNGMSWDSGGWFFGATGEAVRKFYGTLLEDRRDEPQPSRRGRPEKS